MKIDISKIEEQLDPKTLEIYNKQNWVFDRELINRLQKIKNIEQARLLSILLLNSGRIAKYSALLMLSELFSKGDNTIPESLQGVLIGLLEDALTVEFNNFEDIQYHAQIHNALVNASTLKNKFLYNAFIAKPINQHTRKKITNLLENYYDKQSQYCNGVLKRYNGVIESWHGDKKYLTPLSELIIETFAKKAKENKLSNQAT